MHASYRTPKLKSWLNIDSFMAFSKSELLQRARSSSTKAALCYFINHTSTLRGLRSVKRHESETSHKLLLSLCITLFPLFFFLTKYCHASTVHRQNISSTCITQGSYHQDMFELASQSVRNSKNYIPLLRIISSVSLSAA